MSIIFLTLLISHLFIAKLNGEEETTENPLTDNYLLNYFELTTNSPLEGEEEAETRPSRPKRYLSKEFTILSCSPPPPNPFKNTENSPTYNHQISNKLLGDKTYQQQNKTAIRFNDRVSVLSGPIKIPEELHCYDFNDKCRWRNMDGLLVDELDWYQGAGFL
uniref:MAM domain-containing protein n=1 Tax=Meloidogyne floridensis TaxID=298350 RepID=A0A915P0N2_9BILA